MLKNKFVTKNIQNRLYQIPVPVIGLTGGISTGKSTVAKLLKEKNYAVIDADVLVKRVYQKSEVIQFIKDNFSDAIIDGKIDFKILRKVAFDKAENIAKIEKVIYQYLPNEFLQEFKTFTNPEFIFYDVPLLFEKGLDLLVDLKVCVYAPRDIQIDRLMKRDQIAEDQAKKIIDHQMSIEDKKIKSDLTIENFTDLEALKANVDLFLTIITQ